MRGKGFLSIVFLLAVALDQVTKFVVDNYYNLYDSRSILGNVLRLYYIRNSGAVFGLRLGNQTFMLILTTLVTALLVYLFLSGKFDPGTKMGRTAVVFVLGGAVGNLIDRIRMGEVIDFIDMGIGTYRWPKYNFADIYITVGMIVLMFHYLFLADKSDNPQEHTGISETHPVDKI